MPQLTDNETSEIATTWRTGFGSRAARWLADHFLAFVETWFLRAYGWRRTEAPADGAKAWAPPDGHPKAGELYGRTHAVNSTRYYLDPPPRRSQARRGSRRAD